MKTLAFILCLTSAASTAAPVYDLTDLGSLGGSSSAGQAVNHHGQTVGTALDEYGIQHGFNGSATSATTLGRNTAAWDINTAGQVAGVQYRNGESYATIWSTDGTHILAGPGSAALGINESGQVTGMTAAGHVFVTGPDGLDLRDVGTLRGGSWSVGHAINASGTIAGYGMVGSSFRGFRWSEDDGFSMLGTLGGRNSYGMAINNEGLIAGHAQTQYGYIHATLWSPTRTLDLGTLGGNNSYGYGVNNHGWVVGYSLTARGENHAFLYLDGVMYDLNLLLGDSEGWLLTHAYGINDRGQIVGEGIVNGQKRAFRLDLRAVRTSIRPETPATVAAAGFEDTQFRTTEFETGPNAAAVPEPSTWALALTGLIGCAARHARRK